MAEASNRNAIVTGAAGGIGRAITKALLESGRRVVLADRDGESLRQFAAEMGDNTFPIQLDITDAASVDQLSDLIPDAFKPIDILINNAGHNICGRTRFDAGAADDWSAIIQTNLIGLMRVTRSLLPDMVRRNAGPHRQHQFGQRRTRCSGHGCLQRQQGRRAHVYRDAQGGTGGNGDPDNGDAARPDQDQYRPHPLSRRPEEEKDNFDQFKMALDPADIARSIVFALDQPPHVQIAEMLILPVNRY